MQQPLSQRAQSQALEALREEQSPRPVALLGARPDLSFAAKGDPSCRCLSVGLFADPTDPALRWEEGPPRLAHAQWVVALSSEGSECAARDKEGLGASYSGYRVAREDVIVSVETLAPGRPRMSGAIIPVPAGRGRVYVEATRSVYGKPIARDAGRCLLESPGDGARAQAR